MKPLLLEIDEGKLTTLLKRLALIDPNDEMVRRGIELFKRSGGRIKDVAYTLNKEFPGERDMVDRIVSGLRQAAPQHQSLMPALREAVEVMDVNMANDMKKRLEGAIDAPHVGAQVSTLGGPSRVSVMLAISLDPKSSWINGIYENSRYMRFHVQYDGVLEQFALWSSSVKKFRKARFKTIDDAINKINKYIEEVK